MIKNNKIFQLLSLFLLIAPIVIIASRFLLSKGEVSLLPQHKFVVDYQFDVSSASPYWVKTFLPLSNERQQISYPDFNDLTRGFISINSENKVIQWKQSAKESEKIQYSFEFIGKKIVYQISPDLPYTLVEDPKLLPFIRSTQYIQSDDESIRKLALQLTSDASSFNDIIESLYDFVLSMPSSSTDELTDAVSALRNNEASCNGKSRLFAALCRSLQIPSRLVGGMILEPTRKRTSHAWVEVHIGNKWVPFDALNGHFASLPAHYLELYKGDHFLISHKKGISFDYMYEIKKERLNDYPIMALLNIREISEVAHIPMEMFEMLLLLPFGAFLIAILRNVIGIKTYGVFLPVLISLALLETGLLPGILLLSLIIAVVSLLSFPLDHWGIQYNSKIAFMLTAVVIAALVAVKILFETRWLSAATPLFFPIIILTIVSERFAKKVEEEGVKEALLLYGSTLIATLFTYFILSADNVRQFVVTFPEIILSIAGLNLLLGKWIGIRVLEYYRFYKVANFSK